MSDSDPTLTWHHLARAHVLGQFYAGPHLRVHTWMFIFGIKTLNAKEMIGQIPRLLLAAPGSILRKAPKGNTGLSNAGLFQPMPIPEDLQNLLNNK